MKDETQSLASNIPNGNSLNNLTITYRPVVSLSPAKRNARKHSKQQVRQIADSITEFGFTNPVLVDADGTIVAGHGRVAASKLLGLTTLPTIVLEEMTEAHRRAYAIADNKLAELAGWDQELLKLELGELSVAFPDLDLTVTGFATGELDLIILGDEAGTIPADPQCDEVTEVGEIVSCSGDMWLLGPHRLLCGDARDPECYRRLLGDEKAQLVITDPPFNVKISGHARRVDLPQHGDFVMAAGEMSEDEFTAFLATVFQEMAAFSLPGAVHYTFMDWRHLFEMLSAGRKIYDALLNICVWAKDNAGMGSFYRSQHELVLVWRVAGGPHVNNVELGRHGRNRSNIWHYAGANSFGRDRAEMLTLHPTTKPVAMLADAILDGSHRGDLVLDTFAGSGSTIIAAHKVDRRAAAIEIDPKYVDVAVHRFEKLTGSKARHAVTGRTFGQEAKARGAEGDGAEPQIGGAAQ
jgi:DNA modification methylase